MSELKYFKKFYLEKYSLNPVDILDSRGIDFEDIFFKREVHKEIIDSINTNQLTLIVGNPLAGKTRLVFDTFKKIKKGIIYIPIKDNSISEYRLPTTNQKELIVFLDDVDEYCKTPALNRLLHYITLKKIKCIITCRTGPEFDIFKKYLNNRNYSKVLENRFHIKPIDKESLDFIKFCELNQKYFKSDIKNFDGNIGSLMLPLDDMRLRFEKLQNVNATLPLGILLALKTHFHFFNYENTKSCYLERNIKEFTERYCNNKEKYDIQEWEKAKEELLVTDIKLNFIDNYFDEQKEEDYLYIEEAYLDFYIDKNQNRMDVTFKDLSKNSLTRILNKIYSPEEKSTWGFPMKTRDYNILIKNAKNFNEGKEIFDNIKKPLIKDAHSYMNLADLTEDKAKIIELYNAMKKSGIKTVFIPNYRFINKFDNFNELFDALIKLDPELLKATNGTTSRLKKLAKKNPEESLEYLYRKKSIQEIFENPVYNSIVNLCASSYDDYEKYIKPIIPVLDSLNKPLRKNIIKTILKLKVEHNTEELISKHLSGFDYHNEYANFIQDKDYLTALKNYKDASKLAVDLNQKQKILINQNRVISKNLEKIEEKEIKLIIESTHKFLKRNYEELKKITNTNFLRRYLIVNELNTLKEDKDTQVLILNLLSKKYLPKRDFYNLNSFLNSEIKKEILKETLKIKTTGNTV